MLRDEQNAQDTPIGHENGAPRAFAPIQEPHVSEIDPERDLVGEMIDIVGATSREITNAINFSEIDQTLNLKSVPIGLVDLIKSSANYCISSKKNPGEVIDEACGDNFNLIYFEDDSEIVKGRVKEATKFLVEENDLVKKTVLRIDGLDKEMTPDEGYDMALYLAGDLSTIRHFEVVDGFVSCLCVGTKNGEAGVAQVITKRLEDGEYDSQIGATLIANSLNRKLDERQKRELREFRKMFNMAIFLSGGDERALDRLISPAGMELWPDAAKNLLIQKRKELVSSSQQTIFERQKKLKDKGLLQWKEPSAGKDSLKKQADKFFSQYGEPKISKKRPKLLKIGRKAVEETEDPVAEVERPKNVVFMKKRQQGFVEAHEDDFIEMFKDKVDRYDKGVEEDARALFECLQQINNEDGKYEGIKKLGKEFDKSFDGEPFYELKPKHAIGATQKSKIIKSVRVILGTEGTNMYVLGIARSDSMDRDIRAIAKGLAATNGQNNR